MLKKVITNLLVALALFVLSPSFYNSIVEAGYYSGEGFEGEVDDSSVYRIGKNHVRVEFYIMMNIHTGAKLVDTAEVNWDGEPFAILSKSDLYKSDFEQKLKAALIKYCIENY